ncbi:MAG: DUF4234 domain-containing protein [Oribacterium sp.]|nr:DUF4234 domain-containing protein [Oribacterium sp.]
MFCQKCGNQIEDNAKFCPVCGEPVDSVNLKDLGAGAVNAANAAFNRAENELGEAARQMAGNVGGYNNGYNNAPNGVNGQGYNSDPNVMNNQGYNGDPNGMNNQGYNGVPNGMNNQGFNGAPNGMNNQGYNGAPSGMNNQGYNNAPNGGYNGGLRLKEDRSLLMYIVLTIVTCGIYSFFFIYKLAEDVNTACNGDGEETAGLVKYMLLSIITCGIYSLIWLYKLGNRLSANSYRYGLSIQENGTTILMWYVLGSFLCGIGPLVAWHILIKNINAICSAYNRANGL